MSLIDMLMQAQGGDAVDQMSKQFGLTPAQTEQAIAALAPAFATGLKRNAASTDGLGGLIAALSSGQHEKYHDDVSNALAPEGIEEGNGILGHVFGSKDVSRAVAARASQSTGISSDILKQMLPVIASMIMGSLFKQSANTQSSSGGILGQVLGQVMNQKSSAGSNPLGDILGGLLGGGASSRSSSNNPLGDLLGGFLGGGQQGAPRAQPHVRQQDNPLDDIFGDLLNTGPEPETNYQSSVDSIFDQFLDGMQRRR